jgi:streptomycin 6-kinase
MEAWDVEPIRYRVGLRATLRITARARDAATGRAGKSRFYAKVYNKEEEGQRTYQVLRQLSDKAGAGAEGFTVGRPIAYSSALSTLFQEEAHGTSLLGKLRSGEEVAPAVRKVARALAALHLDEVVTPRRRRLRGELARLGRAGKLLRAACPHLGLEIQETVDAVVAGLEEAPPAPTHGDLKPDDVLLDGDRLVLLDLDKFAEGDPVSDVANFLFNLTRVRSRSTLPHDRPRAVARAFAEEYFDRVPETWRARLPYHHAMTLLNKAAGLYRSQVPDWPDKVETYIKEAKDSLKGGTF